ncbi:MAG: LytTR family DNA-binding domain-containing protein [Cyclobacteriaceae bacterium]
MNLRDLKFAEFDTRAQAVMFDTSGVVRESDNSLFEFKIGSSNIFQDIDIFQGMESITSDIDQAKELKFNCVSLSIMGYESHFDFIMRPVEGEKLYYLLIYDFAEQYQRVLELQQERNVRDIESKKLERENKRILEENEVINRLYDQMSQSGSSEYVLLKSDNLLVNIDLNTVDYFEAYGDYIKVHTEAKMYIIHNRMKNIETQLPQGMFVRIHRSFIVQINKIRNIEQMSLDVSEKILPIGKQYKADLLNQMNQL